MTEHNDEWKKRVVTERRELIEKIGKLEEFLSPDNVRVDLNAFAWSLLVHQLVAMKAYAAALDVRIRYF